MRIGHAVRGEERGELAFARPHHDALALHHHDAHDAQRAKERDGADALQGGLGGIGDQDVERDERERDAEHEAKDAHLAVIGHVLLLVDVAEPCHRHLHAVGERRVSGLVTACGGVCARGRGSLICHTGYFLWLQRAVAECGASLLPLSVRFIKYVSWLCVVIDKIRSSGGGFGCGDAAAGFARKGSPDACIAWSL